MIERRRDGPAWLPPCASNAMRFLLANGLNHNLIFPRQASEIIHLLVVAVQMLALPACRSGIRSRSSGRLAGLASTGPPA
jgi:hypothetical protein